MELSQLEAIFAAYDGALGEAQKKVSIFTGLFGSRDKDDPRNHPCNREFYEKTGNWVREFAASNPAEAEVMEVCRLLMTAAARRKGRPTHWYTLVAQGYIKELVPLLSRENRQTLAAEYEALWPRRKRLPLQDEICKALSE